MSGDKPCSPALAGRRAAPSLTPPCPRKLVRICVLPASSHGNMLIRASLNSAKPILVRIVTWLVLWGVTVGELLPAKLPVGVIRVGEACSRSLLACMVGFYPAALPLMCGRGAKKGVKSGCGCL